MSAEELYEAVRLTAPQGTDVEATEDGCIAAREGKAIQFWVQDPDEDSFHYTRTIGGAPDGLGPLSSNDVSDVLKYL